MAAKLAFCLGFLLPAGLWVCALASLAGCGYHAVYGDSSAAAIAVAPGQALVPDTIAEQAALAGARAELAAAGRLASAGRYPRLVVDVLRVDEVSRGIHVQAGAPAAGGMSLAVVVRGRLLPAPEQESSVDTGDVRRASTVSGSADPRADSAAYDLAVRDAAERAGRAAARIVLGIPEPADEAP